MRRKKWLALILAACMGISCLAGCQNTSAGGDQTSAASGSAAQDRDSSAKETVKLTALISKHSLTKDVNEMEWLKLLEEENGVEVEWQQITADWDQKKSVTVALNKISGISPPANITLFF